MRREFSIADLLSKYGFMDGEDVLPEEKPLILAACAKLVGQLGIIGNRWKPVIIQSGHSPYFVDFEDLAAKGEPAFCHYDNMPVKERRRVDAALQHCLQGKFSIRVDDAVG